MTRIYLSGHHNRISLQAFSFPNNSSSWDGCIVCGSSILPSQRREQSLIKWWTLFHTTPSAISVLHVSASNRLLVTHTDGISMDGLLELQPTRHLPHLRDHQ
jgi:hypothetical protein